MPPVFTPFSRLHFIIRAWKDKEYIYTCNSCIPMQIFESKSSPTPADILTISCKWKGKMMRALFVNSPLVCWVCVCSAILAEGNKSLMLHVLQTEGVRNSGLEPLCWTKYVMTPFFCFRPRLSKTNIFFSLISLSMDGICYIVTLQPHSLIAD